MLHPAARAALLEVHAFRWSCLDVIGNTNSAGLAGHCLLLTLLSCCQPCCSRFRCNCQYQSKRLLVMQMLAGSLAGWTFVLSKQGRWWQDASTAIAFHNIMISCKDSPYGDICMLEILQHDFQHTCWLGLRHPGRQALLFSLFLDRSRVAIRAALMMCTIMLACNLCISGASSVIHSGEQADAVCYAQSAVLDIRCLDSFACGAMCRISAFSA